MKQKNAGHRTKTSWNWTWILLETLPTYWFKHGHLPYRHTNIDVEKHEKQNMLSLGKPFANWWIFWIYVCLHGNIIIEHGDIMQRWLALIGVYHDNNPRTKRFESTGCVHLVKLLLGLPHVHYRSDPKTHIPSFATPQVLFVGFEPIFYKYLALSAMGHS
jgi:hypothetical protein